MDGYKSEESIDEDYDPLESDYSIKNLKYYLTTLSKEE